MKFTVPTRRRVQVAELLPDLALDLQGRDRRAGDAELEERGLRGEAGADARGQDLRPLGAGRRPPDEDHVRTGQERRGTLETWGGQVGDVEMLPLGNVALAVRDRPVRLRP